MNRLKIYARPSKLGSQINKNIYKYLFLINENNSIFFYILISSILFCFLSRMVLGAIIFWLRNWKPLQNRPDLRLLYVIM